MSWVRRRYWQRLGAHPVSHRGAAGVRFGVWAPRARSVAVVGDFCAWQGPGIPLTRCAGGEWFGFVPHLRPGARYMYKLAGPDDTTLPLKADPVAFASDLAPGRASVVFNIAEVLPEPLSPRPVRSIYEAHLGSWWRGRPAHLVADALAEHVAGLGFSHLELLPVTEHPFRGSWGYQPTGLFSASAFYGGPNGLQQMIAACHRRGVGVILDWVCGQMASDDHGLAGFDGLPLFEDRGRGLHPLWGSPGFDFSRPEVCEHLVEAALFWFEVYRIDGLRVDAVADLLRRPNGDPDPAGMRFLRRLTTAIRSRFPGAAVVAEDSSDRTGTTAPVEAGGLGFTDRWDLEGTHQFLGALRQPRTLPRVILESLGTRPRGMLAFSHDEMVYGKGTLLSRTAVDGEARLDRLRAVLIAAWGMPRAKLLFMGQDSAVMREWCHETGLDWSEPASPSVRDLRHLIGSLNSLTETIGISESSEVTILFAAEDAVVWRLAGTAGSLLFAVNVSAREQALPLPAGHRRWVCVLGSRNTDDTCMERLGEPHDRECLVMGACQSFVFRSAFQM